MAEVTITVDPDRLRLAIDDEISNHWRHLASGLCQCGRSRSKDPSVWRAHMAEEILAVVLRFQSGGIRKEDVVDYREALATCGSAELGYDGDG